MADIMKITGGSLHAKNGFWQVVFYVNHKQKWRSTKIAIPNENPNSSKYKKSRMEAYKCIEMLRKQLKYDLEHPIAKIKGENIKEHISLVSLLREWLQDDASKQVRLQALSTYRNYAEKRIIPFFEQYYPDLEAAALTPQIMHEFTNYMKADKLTNASIRKYLAPVRNALEYGFEKGYLQQNPIAGYRFKPRARQAPDSSRKKQTLSVDACNRLMAAMAADADAPVCVPIMLALHLGLRREEILGLRFRDIDFSAKTLHVQNTRTKVYEIVEEENTKSSASNRILYLDDELVSFLKKIQKKQAQHKLDLGDAYMDAIGYVYVRGDGKTYYPDTVEKQLKKFLKKHGLPPVGLHELRHTYCSRLLTGGIDLTTVQHLMGHSDPRMTLGIYAHVSPEKAEQARGAMRRCLESAGLEAAASNGRH